jgi:hypothetical protein
MIRIDGLTDRQVKFLDKMWSMDTQEEVAAWFRTLRDDDLNMAVTLHEMLVSQMLEQPAEDDVSMAQSMLRDIGVKV